jgi:hypothetical protein
MRLSEQFYRPAALGERTEHLIQLGKRRKRHTATIDQI